MDEVALTIRRARRGNCTALDLSSKGLSSVPADVMKMNSLEDLNLASNSLTSLPANISDLSNLRRLDLSNNHISELPSTILSVPLSYLNLSGNPIGLGELIGPSISQNIAKHCSAAHHISKTVSREEVKATTRMPSAQNTPKDFTPASFKPDDMKLGAVINQGGFSVVQQALWRGTEVAVKLIVDPVITQQLMDEFENEVKMLSYLRHPNTILLMAVNNSPPHLAVATELATRGSVFELLHRSREAVTPDLLMSVARQVAHVFAFYHASGVVHRDLKSMNVLLDDHFTVKICDFGLARFTHELNKGTMQFSGTPSYMAPELFRKQAIDAKVDVYAFGTLLWEMFSRQVPYDGMDPADIKERVLLGDNALPRQVGMPRQIEELITACRQLVPTDRPDFREIVRLLG